MFVLSLVLVCVHTRVCTLTPTGIHKHATKQRYSSQYLTQVSHEVFVLTVFYFLKCSLSKRKKIESVLGTENSSVTASSPLLHRGQESVSINRKKMMGMEPLSIYNVDNRPGFGLNMCPFLGTSRLPFPLLFCFTQLFGPNGQPPSRGSWKTPIDR